MNGIGKFSNIFIAATLVCFCHTHIQNYPLSLETTRFRQSNINSYYLYLLIGTGMLIIILGIIGAILAGSAYFIFYLNLFK
jgi:hypothetical protein